MKKQTLQQEVYNLLSKQIDTNELKHHALANEISNNLWAYLQQQAEPVEYLFNPDLDYDNRPGIVLEAE